MWRGRSPGAAASESPMQPSRFSKSPATAARPSSNSPAVSASKSIPASPHARQRVSRGVDPFLDDSGVDSPVVGERRQG